MTGKLFDPVLDVTQEKDLLGLRMMALNSVATEQGLKIVIVPSVKMARGRKGCGDCDIEGVRNCV